MVTVTEATFYHCKHVDLNGLTVRAALKELRELYKYSHFDSLGTCTLSLSDNTFLCVLLIDTCDKQGKIMASQTMYRQTWNKSIYKYKW